MDVTFSRYDPADFLKSEADIAAYLDAAALGDVVRARNISKLSRDTGLSREGIYKALSGEGNPSFATIGKIADALGLRISFQPIHQAITSAP